MDPASGLVYVVSAVGLAESTVKVQVKATDPRGLHATAKLEVSVEDSRKRFTKRVRVKTGGNVSAFQKHG